jgi:C4-dicarboxylate transporter DctM subunit
VALKLFTGIEKFEIMAIPFFILAGNFLTHGGVAKRMIASPPHGRPLHGGWGLGGGVRLRAVRRGLGLFPRDRGGDRLDPAARDGQAGLTRCVRDRRHRLGGGLGILIPPSIVMVMYAVSTNSSIGALFIAGIIPGACCSRSCWGSRNLVDRAQEAQLSALNAGRTGPRAGGLPRDRSGACC